MIPLWKIKREVRRIFSPRYHEKLYSNVSSDDKRYLNSITNRYLGKRCFVIGNGPSLTVADLEKIKGEVSFASNKIFLIYDQTNWRPDFYCVEDMLVFSQCIDEIRDLTESAKLFPVNMFNSMTRLAGSICFPTIPPENWDDPLADPDFPAFSPDFSRGIAWGSTIVYTEIQLAIAMGFTEIYLLGLDHQYSLGRESTDEKGVLISEGEQNHFHPDYRPVGEKWHSPNLPVLEVSYAKARSAAEAMGIRIVNCSRRTNLTVFEREDLETVLARNST